MSFQWGDLSPFVKGYVGSMLSELCPRKRHDGSGLLGAGSFVEIPMAASGLDSYRAFGKHSDVAIGAKSPTDALASALRSRRNVTLADIDMWVGDHYRPVLGFSDVAPETLARIIEDCSSMDHDYFATKVGGARFWSDRQAGKWSAFAPLTIYLGINGKIYLK